MSGLINYHDNWRGEAARWSDSRKLIVNYLPYSMTDRQFYNLFSQFGRVYHFNVIRDRVTGKNFGFAFVIYGGPQEAIRAIRGLNGYRWREKVLKVSYARPCCLETMETNLYVRNLPSTTRVEDINNIFGAYGTLLQTHLVKDKITNIFKGVAYVRFAWKSDAKSAMESLHGSYLAGCDRPLYVKLKFSEYQRKRLWN